MKERRDHRGLFFLNTLLKFTSDEAPFRNLLGRRARLMNYKQGVSPLLFFFSFKPPRPPPPPITAPISSGSSNPQPGLIRGIRHWKHAGKKYVQLQNKTRIPSSLLINGQNFMILTSQLNSTLIESLEFKLHTSFTKPPRSVLSVFIMPVVFNGMDLFPAND